MNVIDLLQGLISLDALASVFGIAAFCALTMLWLKKYLADWRYTPLVALALSIAVSIVIRLALEPLTLASIIQAVMIGYFGSSVAVDGYEKIANILGLAGVGNRSNASQEKAAIDRLKTAGYAIIDERNVDKNWLN